MCAIWKQSSNTTGNQLFTMLGDYAGKTTGTDYLGQFEHDVFLLSCYLDVYAYKCSLED